MKIGGPLLAAKAFLNTRWLSYRFRSRADIEHYQALKLKSLLTHIRQTSNFHPAAASLSDLQIIDKQILLGNFPDLNLGRLTVDQVREALAQEKPTCEGYFIGHSTGTSGNRGYYVISEAERYVWLGTILAKTLPNALWKRHRVALALPGMSSLYQSAETGSRIALKFFDLARGVTDWADELAQFAPDTIVAPPKVLRYLASVGKLPARHIFSGAEVLDPLDRELIERETGHKVREIYMATEGLLGVACPNGTLHLAEDAVAFEWERSDDKSKLVSPIITDFTRRAQIMARYRMNDLLELSTETCPCGSPLQAVSRIEGRQDDIFLLPNASGQIIMLTPDILRNCVIDASPLIKDFRIVQRGPKLIQISLDSGINKSVENQVLVSFTQMLDKLKVQNIQIDILYGITAPYDKKLRRVRREWSPET